MTDGYPIKFRCHKCGVHDTQVRYRESDEDLINWMDYVIQPGITKAHQQQSPSCTSIKCDLMLPVNEKANGIGMRTKQ